MGHFVVLHYYKLNHLILLLIHQLIHLAVVVAVVVVVLQLHLYRHDCSVFTLFGLVLEMSGKRTQIFLSVLG